MHTDRWYNLDDTAGPSIITDRIGQLILTTRRYFNISTRLNNFLGEDIFTDVGKVARRLLWLWLFHDLYKITSLVYHNRPVPTNVIARHFLSQ